MQCNVERHASAPPHSESWGVVDVRVDFTGLVRRPHRSSRGTVQQCTPKVSLAMTSLDPRWGRIIRAIVVRVLSNSSELKSSCGRVRLSLSDHSRWTPSCCAKKILKHVKQVHEAGRSHDRSGGRMGKLEPVISKTGAAIATQFTISTSSRTQDRLEQSIPKVPSCACTRGQSILKSRRT